MIQEKEILIYGIGNDILSDDGIGPKFVKKLEKELSHTDIKFETAFVGGMELLEYINGFKTVIFIDAIKTKNGEPGTVYNLTPEDFKETLHLSHVHDISFLMALELGKEIGYDIPDNIHILAIEIVEDLLFADSYSPLIQKNIKKTYQTVKDYVYSIIQKEVVNLK